MQHTCQTRRTNDFNLASQKTNDRDDVQSCTKWIKQTLQSFRLKHFTSATQTLHNTIFFSIWVFKNGLYFFILSKKHMHFQGIQNPSKLLTSHQNKRNFKLQQLWPDDVIKVYTSHYYVHKTPTKSQNSWFCFIHFNKKNRRIPRNLRPPTGTREL